MDKEFKEKVERRIANLGYKKEFIAKQIGLNKVQFSQTLSGVRQLSSDEKAALCRMLGL